MLEHVFGCRQKEKSLRQGIQLSLFYIAFNVFQSALSGQVIV